MTIKTNKEAIEVSSSKVPKNQNEIKIKIKIKVKREREKRENFLGKTLHYFCVSQ